MTDRKGQIVEIRELPEIQDILENPLEILNLENIVEHGAIPRLNPLMKKKGKIILERTEDKYPVP